MRPPLHLLQSSSSPSFVRPCPHSLRAACTSHSTWHPPALASSRSSRTLHPSVGCAIWRSQQSRSCFAADGTCAGSVLLWRLCTGGTTVSRLVGRPFGCRRRRQCRGRMSRSRGQELRSTNRGLRWRRDWIRESMIVGGTGTPA